MLYHRTLSLLFGIKNPFFYDCSGITVNTVTLRRDILFPFYNTFIIQKEFM